MLNIYYILLIYINNKSGKKTFLVKSRTYIDSNKDKIVIRILITVNEINNIHRTSYII